MSESLTSELALNCLDAALRIREISTGLIHHSDRGKKYPSHTFRARLAEEGVRQSMSREADCWDKAAAESLNLSTF